MINVISGISVVAIAFATMAMVVVLSAFNGIEGLVDDLYSSFDADIEVRAKKGKVFHEDSLDIGAIKDLKTVEGLSRTIEENALLKHEGDHVIATVKGIEPSFFEFSGLDTMIISGDSRLKGKKGNPRVVLGLGIKKELKVPVRSGFPSKIDISAPDRKKVIHRYKQRAFRNKEALVGGVFSVNVDFDSRYILASLPFSSKLFNYEEQWSALAIDIPKGVDFQQAKKRIQKVAGPKFKVRTRYEKNRLLYKTNRTEKWITFLILSFILIIATFNIIASLTMLIIEKKDDIKILQGMGAAKRTIRRIFFMEGLMINLFGGLLGIILGILLCIAQKTWGLVSLRNAVVAHYPIELHGGDIFAVFGIVIVIGLISASFPVRLLTRKYFRAR
ncbi:MAG: FtsX-like permease family protein [Flavobacteriales bacterium]